jgi:ATP synthase protein I
VKQDTPSRQIHAAATEGWHGASFVSSILAGTLLGYLLDGWLGTEPWLVVVGIILGSYAGFMRLWHYSKKMEEGPRAR